MMLQMLRIIRHNKLQSKRLAVVNRYGMPPYGGVNVLDDMSDLLIVCYPYFNEFQPISIIILLQSHPIILSVTHKIEVWLLHRPHKFLLIVAR